MEKRRTRGLEQIPWLYDTSMAVMERFGALARWRAWLAIGTRGPALEVGCGTGRNLSLYAAAPIVAIDPEPQNLARARRRSGRALLVRASAEALPFKAGAFATVVSSLVFCSVGDPARGLAEVRRVLAPDGELRMIEHVRSRRPILAWLQDRAQPAWTWATGGCRPNRDTEAAVAAAGFEIRPEGRRAKGAMRRFAAKAAPPPASR